MKYTVSDLIDYLLTLPQDAELVTNNSLAWHFSDVYKTIKSVDDIKRYIKYIDNPTDHGTPIEGKYVTIHDARHHDY